MNRVLVEQLVRDIARVSGKHELVFIGSQCVHAITDNPPAEVIISAECDVLLEPDDSAAALIEAELGEDSAYRAEHGVYADVVTGTFPYLPAGYESRLQELRTGDVLVRCLEIYDLALSKLAAGRLKDYEMVAALLVHKLIDVAGVNDRIATVSDLHMRAILLARLQIALAG